MSTTRDSGSLAEDLRQFLDRYYRDEIGDLARHYPSDQQSLVIDYNDLFRFDPDVADDFGRQPGQIRDQLEEALAGYEVPVDVDLADAHVRVRNPPAARSFDVGGYRADQLTEWIGVEGQISKQTGVKPLPEVLAFECQRCGTPTPVPQTTDGDIDEPHECSGCERQGPFRIDRSQSEWTDAQLLRLQLPPEKAQGQATSHLDVYLEDDLVASADAGDRVTVTGELTVDADAAGEDIGLTPHLRADAVTVEESDYQDIDTDEHLDEIRALARGDHGDPYELLVESIAPTIEGMREIKEALALQLFGGVRARYPDGSHDRGEPHILLLGDPGTAKSSLLEDIEDKAPRSTYASGKGATAAGLTAAAVTDDFGPNEYSLEAGALVLADNGIAAIDEIDKVSDDAVASLHEALSTQQIHVNKADINARLPTRTALLAAGNPKHGRFVRDQPIADQIDLGPTLLSRFDLLFMIDDHPDAEQDREITEGMIESRQHAVRYSDPDYRAADGEFDAIAPAVETELLRAWVAHAKAHVYPAIESSDVAAELRESFTNLRTANGEGADTAVPVTFRRLEALQRLAEASARVRLSSTVDQQDIDRARRLLGRSMRDVGMDPDGGLDADIIETGMSSSQRDLVQWLEDFIAAQEGADPVPHERIVEAADKNGYDESRVVHEIQKLKTKGELYEPQSEHYRTT